jgi:hypothetical protein
LFDAYLQPVPVGIPGELYVGGAGVARGYLRAPDVTAERFVPNPFSAEEGARLYKTGDRARWRPDGRLEYLGRTDLQVKVRGYRIEPGEIEAVLAAHPGVREAVVLAREDTPEERRLVAYVLPNPDAAPSVSELGRFLQGKLPDYMRPAAFVFVKAWPLTAHGKLDRRALPAPDQARPPLATALVAPRSAPERLLADIWRGVLRVQEIGVHDSFFELGGNSIQAALVINKLQQSMGTAISLAALFEAPTIAAFSAYLAEHHPDALAKIDGHEVGCAEPRGLPTTVPGESPQALLAGLDQLSDQQVDALLNTMDPDGANE